MPNRSEILKQHLFDSVARPWQGILPASTADGMIRKHHARKTDFRKGQKNGIGDHQVQWSKPQQ